MNFDIHETACKNCYVVSHTIRDHHGTHRGRALLDGKEESRIFTPLESKSDFNFRTDAGDKILGNQTIQLPKKDVKKLCQVP